MSLNDPGNDKPANSDNGASSEETGDSIYPDTRTILTAPDLNKGVPDDPVLIRALSNVEMAVSVGLFTCILFGVMYQVLGRYFPALSWVGSGELALLSMIAMTFMMAGYLVGRNGHIVLEIFDALLAGTRLFIALRVTSAIIMVLTCLALAYEAFVKIEVEWIRISGALEMPLGVLYIFALVGFASGAIQSAYKIRHANRPERHLDFSEMEG